MISIGKRIKELRKGKELTQEDLARKISATRSAVANWEIGRAMPDLHVLTSLADFFDISVDYLLERTTYTSQNHVSSQVAEGSSLYATQTTPTTSTRHQEVLTALLLEIAHYLKDKPYKIYPAPFNVRLNTSVDNDEKATTVVQPDLTIICDTTKIGDWGCQGSPDWIIEIVSPATVKEDMKEKLALYEQAGIPEYWIVHPVDHTVLVFTLQENNTYGTYHLYTEEDEVQVSIFNDLIIHLQKVFK